MSKNEPKSFTCFAKFGESCSHLSAKDKEKMGAAIFMYGMFGVEIELKNSLKGLFVLMKDDIDNSRTARSNAEKGGRPKKPQVSENEKPQVSKKEAQKTKPNTDQYRPIKEKEEKKKSLRFSPPTKDEVAAFASENSLPLDVSKFFDHYEANGWKVGRNSMKDWKAAARRAAKEWAVDTSPPIVAVKAECPSCGSPMWKDTQVGDWHCSECGEVVARGAVA